MRDHAFRIAGGQPEQNAAEDQRLKDVRVLVVDDNATNRELTAELEKQETYDTPGRAMQGRGRSRNIDNASATVAENSLSVSSTLAPP